MNKNVYELAQENTSLKKVSFKEYAGPCPRCGGSDRFRVQPGRKDNGAWMCRNCWDPATKGWGDGIEYLRQMRGMSFSEAKNHLAGELDSLLERTERVKAYVEPTATGRNAPPNNKWQAWTARYVEQAIARLWSSAGLPGLDYLHSRGLKDATIKAAQLGYEEIDSIPYVVIPWHVGDGQYWRVNKRDIRPDVPHDQRYKNIAGSSNAGLYGGELLTRKRPTFLVEGELDALSIAQEAGDLPINVVATGGLDCSRVPRWVARLARVPHVLVAYDNEQRGEEASNTWLKILTHNALRYRPLAKDANAMLLQGWSIRTWVQGALDLLSEPETIEPATPAKSLDTCFSCSAASWIITDTNEAYCKACWKAQGHTPASGEACCLCGDFSDRADDETLQPYCESCWLKRSSSPAWSTQEDFLATVHQLAARLEQDTGVSWHVRSLPQGYTIQDRVREIEQERAAWKPRGKVKAR